MSAGRTKVVGSGIALCLLGMLSSNVLNTACLGSLPEPTQCPPASVYSACPLRPMVLGPPLATPDAGPAAPVGPTVGCVLDSVLCLKEQGRPCGCTSETECKKTDATCTPAPECPRTIRDAESGATCIETGAAFIVAGGPPCACGCASCATTCDGQGPVIGPNETVRFDLPGDLPASGRLGVMARLRGGGRALFVVRTLDISTVPIGESPADSDFAEKIARSGPTTGAYSWGGDRLRPVAIELHGDPDSAIEVDCVVPFLSR